MSRLIAARVRGGVIVPDVALPDGTEVTVAVNDSEADNSIELSEAESAALDEAIGEADRMDESQLVTTRAVLAELDRIQREHKP
jgi:hypothetical protein